MSLPEPIRIACENAQRPGECSYVLGCVIAHLGVQYGVGFDDWPDDAGECDNPANAECFEKIPFDEQNLMKLQDFWDSSYACTSDDPNEAILQYAKTLDWS